MSDTYCGKSCESCEFKVDLSCAGCKTPEKGPGSRESGECELASCCRTQECNACIKCRYVSKCQLYAKRETVPRARINKIKTGRSYTDDAMKKKMWYLSNWMKNYFVASLIYILVLIVVNASATILEPLAMFASVISLAGVIVIIVMLFKLGKEEALYGKAAVFQIVAAAFANLNVIVSLLPRGATVLFESLMNIGVLVFAFLSVVCEVKGHSGILKEADMELSETWSKFLKCIYGVFGLAALSVILYYIPIGIYIGFVAEIVLVIVMFIILTMRLGYLSKTVKALQRKGYSMD